MNTYASTTRILGIVVTYFPSLATLSSLATALSGQVHTLLIVDNTPGAQNEVSEFLAASSTRYPNINLVRLGGNFGIAYAQNVGIHTALSRGFSHVLLCDQDSQPAEDMVEQLLHTETELRRQGIRVGSVCPSYVDQVTGNAHLFQVQEAGKYFYSSVPAYMADPWLELITGIASGSLIPAGALREVGPMCESLFIDFVDTEWCHRARHHGYRIFGTAKARMTHRPGDESFSVWFGRWKRYPAYSPLRLHYRFRNAVLLLRSPHVPWPWKVRSAWTWLGDMYAYVLFSRQKIANLRAITLGIMDGIRNRSGDLHNEA